MILDSRVNGKTRLIGVVGNPVEHSISPQLHNTISSYLGPDIIYVPFKVAANDLENAVKGLKAINILGFNITIPYKKDIMKYIDDNTKEALLMGAVNTVKNIDGRLYGYNTDAEGFARSYKEETKTGFRGKNVVVFGAGGVARAIIVKVAMDGAQKISIVNRTESKAIEMAELVSNNFKLKIHGYCSTDKKVNEIIMESDIIINTTSMGMHPELNKCPIENFNLLNSNQIVYDVIYNPIETVLLSEASKKGCKTVNGLGMLYYQGINAYEIWTGIKIPEAILKELFLTFKDILNK